MASLLQGVSLTTKEVELATFLGFQGVPNLQISEDVSGTFLPIDQEVTAKEKEKVRVLYILIQFRRGHQG